MIKTIATIFGKSPFAPLEVHMAKVAACVNKGKEILEYFYAEDFEKVEAELKRISDLEHEADLKKVELRAELPKSIFLPIDRGSLLEILSLQDSIANTMENVAVLLSLKPLKPVPDFLAELKLFASKNFETFDQSQEIIKELSQLAHSSFGGVEAQKVKQMIDKTAYLEHEADILQQKLLKKIFNCEAEISVRDFHLWMKLTKELAAVADLSDNLAHKILITLQLT